MLPVVLLIKHLIHQVMGFRRRSNLSIRPVHRIKHVVDNQSGIALGVKTGIVLAIAKDAPVLANTTEVETGSKVNGIYLKVECYATSAAALANVYMGLFKNPGGNLTSPNPNVVGSSDNKKYFIHQEMVMLEQKVSGNPRTLFNGVIVIPRGYRRMGPNDELTLFIISPGVNINLCLQCHYKEFR